MPDTPCFYLALLASSVWRLVTGEAGADSEFGAWRAEEGDKAGPDWLIDLYSPDVNHEMLSVNQI